MTKLFVPLFAAAILAFGNLNAQTDKNKHVPVVKKETAPVNKRPVPIARPVVPVTKPVHPPVSVSKPAAKPVVPAAKTTTTTAKTVTTTVTKPAAQPVKKVTTITKKTVVTEPCPPIKKVSKTVKKKHVVKTKRKAPVASPVVAQPVRDFTPREPEVVMPMPPAAPAYVYTEEVEKESSNAPCEESWKSIRGCSCYKHLKGRCGHWRDADCGASCRYIRKNHKNCCTPCPPTYCGPRYVYPRDCGHHYHKCH